MLQRVLAKNGKKNHQKDAIHLRNNKNTSHRKRYKKVIEKWKIIKSKKYKKKINDNKILHFYFLYMEKICFAQKPSFIKYRVY